ncbi:MAG: NUDIX hydrolase [Pleomorphochaeta sp.]
MKVNTYHGAGMLLWHKEEDGNISVLLGRRSFNPCKNLWNIPGGGFEDKKDGYDNNLRAYYKTAIRETYEEFGIEVDNLDKRPLWKMHVPFFNWEVYESEIKSKINPSFNMEFSTVNWFDIEDLPSDLGLFVKSQIRNLKKKISS